MLQRLRQHAFYANTRDSGGSTYTIDSTCSSGSTFNTDNEDYVPAKKLTSSDVGLDAPDPCCQ